jgi:transcription elongation factor GreA-like protein
MRNYFDDEEDDDEDFDEGLIIREMESEKETKERKEFIRNCNDAYKAIKTDPDNIVNSENPATKKDNLINALNRMSALFILQEEYEKCETLKRFAKAKIPEIELTPNVEEIKKFLGQ